MKTKVIIFLLLLAGSCYILPAQAKAASNTFFCTWDDGFGGCRAVSQCNPSYMPILPNTRPEGTCLYVNEKTTCINMSATEFTCVKPQTCPVPAGQNARQCGSDADCTDPNKPVCAIDWGGDAIFCTCSAKPGQSGGSSDSSSVVGLTALINGMGFKFNANSKLGDILSAALPIIFAITGMALLIYMIIAGFKFLTSAGDAKKLESAKGALTAAIIGFIIIFVAFWVTQIVNFVFKLGAGI